MTGVGRAALITAAAATTTIVVDRSLKAAIEHTLSEGEPMRGPFDIQLRRRTNERGVAGAHAHGARHATLLTTGAALTLGIAGAGMLLRRPKLVPIGAGLVAGGMASNLADRARTGRVTDFLATPLGTINAADVAIGAGLLLGGIGLALR